VTPDELIGALKGLKVWKRGTQRAPHKALLLLQALGSLSRGDARLQPYKDVEVQLTDLLNRFGHPRRTPHPEAPFTRLESELWEIPGVEPEERIDLKIAELRQHTGGFPESVANLLRDDPELVSRAANLLLQGEFEESYHDRILEAVGLTLSHDDETRMVHRLPRDPRFRNEVIKAYSYRCAVCGYDTRLSNDVLGLEAAHILWHAKGGPDEVPNGLALCAIHHAALDRGGISLDDDLNLLVASELHGTGPAESLFLNLEGQPIQSPRKDRDAPNPEFLKWHRQEVFRDQYPQRAGHPSQSPRSTGTAL